MFERFTDGARRVIGLAQGEARSHGHAHIGTEHLLLGLLREGDSPAVLVLDALGIPGERVRAQVEEVISRGPGSPQQMAFTPRVKKVLELSLIESRRLGHPFVGPEHLLLGLVAEDEGTGAQILARNGAGLSRVREQVAAMAPPDPVPDPELEPEFEPKPGPQPGPQPVETPEEPLVQRLDRIEQALARMADTLEAVLRRLDDRS